MLGRTMTLLYGTVSYAIFFVTFLYAAGFLGNFLVPKGIDSPATLPLANALAINVALLGIFAVQHSGMARPGFKKWLTRFVPQPAERSTYVLISSVLMIAMFWLWQPLGGSVWDVQNPVGKALLQAGFAFGFLLVLVSTFLINHFDLFGLRQVWLQFRRKDYTPLPFVTPGPYKVVRHPLYIGWLFAFWSTPTMTATHLLFAVATTAYILVAIRLEERDLCREHETYPEYRRSVPALIPARGRTFAPARPAARTEGALG